MCFDDDTINYYGVDFDVTDVPHEKFIFGAEAFLVLRNKKLLDKEISYASCPKAYGLEAAIHSLFYDFHSLMNNEVIFLHLPKYIRDKKFKMNEEEYKELDELAKLMVDSDKNFIKLRHVWDNVEKFRILSGGMN